MSTISATHPRGAARTGKAIFAVLWAIAFLFGAYGIFQRLALGHEIANYGSYVPWGLWVAMYVYSVGLSAGTYLLSSAIYVGGMRRLEGIGKLALFTSLIALVSGLFTIWLDLGHLERFWEVYTRPNVFSMMAWMVWLYTIFFVLVAVELYFALRADMRSVKLLATLGVPLAIAFSGGVGALFGVVGARPYWNSPLYPILFLVSALTSGAALLTFLVAAFWPARRSAEFRDLVSLLGRITLALLILDLLFEWAEISVSLYASIPAEASAYRAMLFGPYWWAFWLVHLALGAVVPALILLFRSSSAGWVGLSGLLIAATFLAVRVNIVIPGEVIPEIRGLEVAYQEAGLSFQYLPSTGEWLVGLFVLAMAVLLFTLGYTNLPLVGKSDKEAGR